MTRIPAERAIAATRSNLAMYPLIAIVGVVSSTIVARTLTLTEFAVYALALSVRGTAQFLADLGTGSASQRHFAQLENVGAAAQARLLYRQLALVRAGTTAVLVTVVVAIPGLFAEALGLEASEHYFLWFALGIGVLEIAAGLGYYALSGTFRQRRVNQVALAQGIVQPLAIFGAVALDLGLKGVLASVMLGSAVRATGLNLFAIAGLRSVRDSGPRVEDLARSFAGVAVASIIGKAAAWAHSRHPVTIFVAGTAPRPALAVFALAYDFTHQVLTSGISPLAGLVLPLFSVENDDDRRVRLLPRVTRALGLMLLPAATVLAVASPALMPLIFGERFENAWQYVVILAPCAAIDLVLSTSATGIMLADRRLIAAYSRVRGASLIAVVAYPLLGGAHLLAVTACMMAVRIAASIALHVSIYRRTGGGPGARWLLRLLAACVLAGALGALGLLVGESHAFQTGAIVVTCSAAILYLIRILHLLSPEDVALVRRVVPAAGRLIGPLASRR